METENQLYKLSVKYSDDEMQHEWQFDDIEEANAVWNAEAKWENTVKGVIYALYPFRDNGDYEVHYRGDFA